MADPWTDDLAALGERTSSQLRSIAATRASLRMEPKMSFFKRRPILATALAAAVLAIAAPVAYAIGTKIFISIDRDKPAPEIEQDVQRQLDSAGVKADVHAEKFADGKLKVQIRSTDPAVGSSGLQIAVTGGGSAEQIQRELRVDVKADNPLDDAQRARLTAALSEQDVQAAIEAENLDADHVEEVVTDALVNAGFKAVQVDVDADSVTVHVAAPPAP